MRKIALLLALFVTVVLFATSCIDNSNIDYEKQLEEKQKQIVEQFAKDSLIIQQYIADHQLTAQRHKESGIYYIVNKPGDENHPNDN